jgi:hypothetical protein
MLGQRMEGQLQRGIVRWLLLLALVPAGLSTAQAAEKGLIIRAGDLMAQPFIDAAKTGPVTPNQPVTILERRGAWANVESNGKAGWVRLLNLRLEPRPGSPAAARPAGASPPVNLANPASLLRTGSSGRTVTTGVKGMDEEDIRNATPDFDQVGLLDRIASDAADARSAAQKQNLKENTVDYLDKGKKK